MTTEPTPTLHAALQAELAKLIAEPLTAKSLRQIEETAKLARMLLSIGKVPDLPKKGYIQPVRMVLDDDEDDGYVGAPGYDAPLAPAPKAETFAATIIREAVSAYADAMNRPKPVSPVEAVLAIKYARDSGLDQLADKLEREIAECGLGSVVAEGVAVPTVISPPPATRHPEAVPEVVRAAVDAYLAKADEELTQTGVGSGPHAKGAAAS